MRIALPLLHTRISCLAVRRPKGLLKQKAEATRAAVHFNQKFLSVIEDCQRAELGLPSAASDRASEPAVESASATSAANVSTTAGANQLVAADNNSDLPQLPAPLVSQAPMRSSAQHFYRVKSLLRLLVRDWSSEGMLERELCYGPLLAELATHLPVTAQNRGQQRVLVPGCGLGRLPLEVAARGYAAQGNDASYFMLFTSAFIMNKVTKPESMRVYPWIHDSNNHFRPADMLRPVSVPDVAPVDMLAADPHLQITMSSGAFLDTYSGEEHDGKWDSVVTSFFLDTAPVALEYMLCIYRLLKPGGIWCNMGPLQYHWAGRPDAPSSNDGGEGPTVLEDGPDVAFSQGYDRSVELSYLELRHACVAAGFQFVSEATRTCTYSADLHGMAKTVYSCVLFTVRKPPVGGGALQRQQQCLSVNRRSGVQAQAPPLLQPMGHRRQLQAWRACWFHTGIWGAWVALVMRAGAPPPRPLAGGATRQTLTVRWARWLMPQQRQRQLLAIAGAAVSFPKRGHL